MKVWTTLLGTDDYLEAVLTLEESRKRVASKYPLVVICFNDLDYNTYESLDQANIKYETFPRELFQGEKRNKDYSVTIGKFYAYVLKNVSRFCFIDADSFFVENIDYILDISVPVFFVFDPSFRNGYTENMNCLTGCIFSDNTSQEKFDCAFTYKEQCREDEQVLPILADKSKSHMRICYRDWTLRHQMVVFHESAYSTAHKFWNRPNYDRHAFLNEVIYFFKHDWSYIKSIPEE